MVGGGLKCKEFYRPIIGNIICKQTLIIILEMKCDISKTKKMACYYKHT